MASSSPATALSQDPEWLKPIYDALLRVPLEDPDAENARWLALVMIESAAHLERRADASAWRTEVRRTVDAFQGLSDPRPNVEDNLRRNRALEIIDGNKDVVRQMLHVSREKAWVACFIEILTKSTMDQLCSEMPGYAARFQAHRDLIAEMVATYVEGRGAPKRGRPILRGKLCEAMGWTPSEDSIRRSRNRRR